MFIDSDYPLPFQASYEQVPRAAIHAWWPGRRPRTSCFAESACATRPQFRLPAHLCPAWSASSSGTVPSATTAIPNRLVVIELVIQGLLTFLQYYLANGKHIKCTALFM